MDTNQKLALLQAYPLGTLEVEIAPEGKRATLVGLSSDGGALVRTHDGARLALSSEDLKPFLKSFAALTKQLPDGTIAAVEVAKMVAGNRRWGIEAVAERIIILRDSSGLEVVIKDMIDPAIGWTIDAYSGRTHQQLLNVLEAYDHLRRNCFALPLNGQPLVAGVDFIEKQD